MNERATAIIHWLSPEEGGRKHLPSGYKYISPAQFRHSSTDILPDLWSLIVETSEPLDKADTVVATIRFLSSEHAPAHYLSVGMHFHLLEGKRTVAIGEIVEDNPPATNRNGANRVNQRQTYSHKALSLNTETEKDPKSG
jgi:hypothetical protein